jgi:hypothetical protein
MADNLGTAEIHDLLAPLHAWYEVSPYYVFLDVRPVGAHATEQRIQAGYDVSVLGLLEHERLPLFQSDAAQRFLAFLASSAEEIQRAAGDRCTVEILPRTDSVVLDAQQHFRPEGVLLIRIGHHRGLDQPAGSAEDGALKAVRNLLRELGVKGP